MTDSSVPKVSKAPFLIVDLAVVGAAWMIFNQSHRPMLLWELVAIVALTALGAYCTLIPFLREYEEEVKRFQSDRLTTVTEQVKNLADVGNQIASASAQLYSAIEASGKAVNAADDIAKRMADEAMQFAEFMKKANDSEKAHLRLEVEKLRRTESDWLQVVVRILDHIYAVNQAAARTGQRNLIDQLAQFQNACRDAARRVGLVTLTPNAGDTFDEKVHQLLDGQQASPGAVIDEVAATGYSFQGQPIRHPLVTLRTAPTPAPEPEVAAEPVPEQPAQPAAGELEEPTLL